MGFRHLKNIWFSSINNFRKLGLKLVIVPKSQTNIILCSTVQYSYCSTHTLLLRNLLDNFAAILSRKKRCKIKRSFMGMKRGSLHEFFLPYIWRVYKKGSLLRKYFVYRTRKGGRKWNMHFVNSKNQTPPKKYGETSPNTQYTAPKAQYCKTVQNHRITKPCLKT